MKRLAVACLCSAALGCQKTPEVKPVPVAVAFAPQGERLAAGDDAILWSEDVTETQVLMWAGHDRRRMVTPSIGSRVVYLGKLPARRNPGREEARVKLSEGEEAGTVGFVPLENVHPLGR
jgi:hypothetical protein